MRKLTKQLMIAAVSTVALALTACMSSGSNPASSNNQEAGYATVFVQAKTKNVNRLSKPGLGKSAAIELKTLVVTAISNAPGDVADSEDTVVTVINEGGPEGLVEDPTEDQVVGLTLQLKALRNWTITVQTFDQNDSVVQEGDTTLGILYAGEIKNVALTATPNYTMYTAKIHFPDSIFSATGITGQRIVVTKTELLIDGVVRADSAGALADSVELSYDYVTPSAGNVTLKVYGYIPDADEEDPTTESPWSDSDDDHLLFTETVAISSLNPYPANNSVDLLWQGPMDGDIVLTVTIKAVGRISLVGNTNPVVLPKKQ